MSLLLCLYSFVYIQHTGQDNNMFCASSSSSAIGMLFLLMLLVIIAHCHCWLSPTPRSALRRASPGGEGHETLHDPAVVPSICSSFFRAFEDPTGRAAEEAEGEGEKRERGGGDNFLMVSFSYGWCSGTVVLWWCGGGL